MEYLFSVYWKTYRIGFVLKKDKKFVYIYDNNSLNNALNEGFDKLIGFPNINEIYVSSSMFPIFLSRIKNYERQKRDNDTNNNFIDNLIKSRGELITDSINIRIDKDYHVEKQL